MGSISIDSKLTPPEAYELAQKYIRTSAMEIKETSVNQKIIAGGERDYDTTILIILLLLVGIFALIYYFTRKKNFLSVTITAKDQGSNVNIMATGPRGEALLHFLYDMLR